MGFAALFAIILLIWAITTKSNPSTSTILNNGAGLIGAATVICSVIIGAIAGAYDVDQGTMRYLVLTGRPRWQLVGVRYLGLFCSVILFTLPGLLIVALTALILGHGGPPDSGGDPAGGTAWFQLFYGTWIGGMLYGLLALSVGTFLKSNGVAIAVAIVLNFAGVLAAALIWQYIWHTAGDIFYPIIVGAAVTREAQTAGPDASAASLSMTTTVIALIGWIVVLVGAAIWRVQRSEY
jgi:ABC-type transport system involved in multi-copper enzyme maturation permease subunit